MIGLALLHLALGAGCVDGTVSACTLSGCLRAERECIGGTLTPCYCAIQTCDDGNACTTDGVAGSPGAYFCTHSPRTGQACSDGDPCNGTETCTAGGACVPGTPPDVNDGNACSYDYCTSAGVQHDAAAATCSSSGGPAGDGAEAAASPGLAPSPLAQPVPAMAMPPGLEVVENTGEVRYRYAFDLPAARGRYQPALALTYSNTSKRDEGYGAGWTLPTSYVELPAQGVPYQLEHAGQRGALVGFADGTARPEIGSAFVAFTAGPAGWQAVDVVGNSYDFSTFFGWVSGSGGRWYLTSVTDVDGNKTRFTYQRETGPAALLTRIDYNNYPGAAGDLYASAVQLDYIVGTKRQLDVAGGRCELTRRLQRVTVQGTSALPLRQYVLSHDNLTTAAPARPPTEAVLSAIRLYDALGTKALPATTFQYDIPAPAGYSIDPTGRAFAAPMTPTGGLQDGTSSWWQDLDGDGLPDRVAFITASGGLKWARNITAPGSAVIQFAPAVALAGTQASGTDPGFPVPGSQVVDLTGDGLPDLVQDGGPLNGSTCNGLIARIASLQNGQPSYSAPICVDGANVLPTYQATSTSTAQWLKVQEANLEDVNRDGAADYRIGSTWFRMTIVNGQAAFAAGQPVNEPLAGIAFPYPADPVPVPLPGTTCMRPPSAPAGVPVTCYPLPPPYTFDPRALKATPDLDGDGISDWVVRPGAGELGCTVEPCPWVVYWGGSGILSQGPMLALPAALARSDWSFPASLAVRARPQCGCEYVVNGQQVDTVTVGNSTFWGWDAGFVDVNGDGVADYVTDVSAGWVAYLGQLPPLLLSKVTTGAGASAALTYALASTFKAGPRQGVPWVATSVSVSGPRMPSATSYYWYDQPRGGQLWYQPLKYEPRGFARTLVYDGATQLVRETTWATGSHAFVGSPTRITWATAAAPIASYNPAQPPTRYTEFRRTELTLAAKPRGSSSCNDSSIEPGGYPAIPVTALAKTTAWIGAAAFASQRTVSCADVDDHGNIKLAVSDPDAAVTGDEVYQFAKFDPTATCESCPVETTTTSDAAGNAWLSRSLYYYDSPVGTWNAPLAQGLAGKGHLAYVRRYSSTSSFEVSSATIYNANGTPASQVMDPYPGAHASSWTESYTYDAQGLWVTRTTSSDAGVTLVKDASYDHFGRVVQEMGPYVLGSTLDKPTRVYAYDDFGRVLAVFRNGSRTETIAATEYVDSSAPAVKSYTFLAPLTIAVGSVPTRPDVKQVVTHLDGLGRVVEARERLGVAGTPDARAQISQVLSGYRVTRSVKYDAAGRVVATLEPLARGSDSTDAYEGFDALSLTANQRGAMTLFDAQGWVTCTKAGIYPALVADARVCASSFTEDASYRLATSYQYGAEQKYDASGKLRWMATAKAVPPGRGTVQPKGTTAFYRADGLLDSTADHFVNGTKLTYDLLGRPDSFTRTAAGKPVSAQKTSKKYDLLGRVTQEWDPNWSPSTSEAAGSRLYSYDGMGRVHRVQLPFDPLAMARAELRYEYKSLGRRTRAYANEPSLVSGNVSYTARELANLVYDRPYAGSVSYPFVAGRLASATSPLTTIALGYDQNGRTTRRDQWFTGLSGPFTATGTFADDGPLLSASFSGALTAATWKGSYDSAGRPVQVAIPAPDPRATTLWETASSYDALERVGVVKSNGGLVTTSRAYAAYSGQLTSHSVTTGTTGRIYDVGGIIYLGTKLTNLSDTGTNTAYTFGYDANGRALSATASGGTGTLAQSYTQAYSFSDPAWPAGATVGNLERVTDGSSVVNHDYMQDRLVSTSSAAGVTLTTNFHDHAGRLTSKRTGGVETEGFVYDLQDHFRQVRRGGVVTERLEYDPTGAPLFRMVGNQAVYYVGPFATVTATVNAGCTGYGCAQGVTGVQVSAHVLLAGSRIASVRVGSVLYYHRDQRGSVVATTVTGGGVGAKYRYGPYGQLDKVEGETSSTGSELGFTGGLRLGWNPSTATQTGSLLLLGARVYDAALRRWLQADLVDEKRYTYADGDPVNLVDPTGREPLSPAAEQQAVFTGVQSGSFIAIYQGGELVDVLDINNPMEVNQSERMGWASDKGSTQPVDLSQFDLGRGVDVGRGFAAGGWGDGRGGFAGSRRAELYVRSFAPFRSFGGGFAGDNRGFSTNRTATSRMWARIPVDLSTGSVAGEPVARSSGTSCAGPPCSWALGAASAEANVTLAITPIANGFVATLSAANPLISIAPNIDLSLSFQVRPGGAISASLRGDAFPNAEVFILGSDGPKMLITYQTLHYSLDGPGLALWGTNSIHMGTFNGTYP